ncbi:MAG: hypothetical protein F4025_10120 [Synechococcus sp. SB0669_bin_7]|nr:hypothetical protein [Synechococcus sp. SB0669_bin_7]
MTVWKPNTLANTSWFSANGVALVRSSPAKMTARSGGGWCGQSGFAIPGSPWSQRPPSPSYRAAIGAVAGRTAQADDRLDAVR